MKNVLKNIPEKEIIESLIYNYRRKLLIYRLIDEKMTKNTGWNLKNLRKKM